MYDPCSTVHNARSQVPWGVFKKMHISQRVSSAIGNEIPERQSSPQPVMCTYFCLVESDTQTPARCAARRSLVLLRRAHGRSYCYLITGPGPLQPDSHVSCAIFRLYFESRLQHTSLKEVCCWLHSETKTQPHTHTRWCLVRKALHSHIPSIMTFAGLTSCPAALFTICGGARPQI